MKQIVDLDLDKKFTDFVLNRISFTHIHPNILTSIGLITDFLILFSASTGSMWALGIFLFVRYSCDCLDGAVARKYNKVSDFGGVLDTLADNVLIYIITLSYLIIFGVENYLLISLIPVVLNVLYLFYCNSFVHHYKIKQKGNWFHNFYRWGVNNNIVIYLLIFIGFLALL